MSAKDLYHEQVKKALIKDGWTITNDPLSLPWGGTTLHIDIGAERIIAAERAARKIAVEVKSFVSPSRIADLKDALSSFVLYRHVLRLSESNRELYIAVREDVYLSLFDQPYGKRLCLDEQIRLIVFDIATEEVVKWLP